MKLAYIVSEFPSLSETFILSQITSLLERGHEVDIYATRRGDAAARHPDVERYRLLARTRYHPDFSTVNGRARRLVRAAGIIGRMCLRRPSAVRRWLGVLRRDGAYRALNLLFTADPFWRRDYDTIVTHFGPNGNAWLWLKDWTRAKYACAFYGYDVSSYVRKHGSAVYRELFRRGDLFLALSQCMADQLAVLGCDRGRIVIHPLGVNVQRFIPRHATVGTDQPIRVLTVARLVEKKGLPDAIEAVRRVMQQGLAVEYTIVGTGPLEEQLKTLIREREVERSVRLAGPRTSDEVATLMAATDLFLLPSVTAAEGDQEGTPPCLLEAQACGIPVLSTRHSGIPEIVVDGRSGFLVPERDVEALADRLARLIQHPELRRQFGAYGRRFVEDRHDISQLSRRLAHLFEALSRHGLTGVTPQREPVMSDAPVEAPRGPDISVILATRNRAPQLRGALQRLAGQETGARFVYEVVVVDNGSTDDTRRVVETARGASPVPVRYVYEPTAGKSWALNAGMRAAQGRVFAFTDDDIEPLAGWLAALWQCFEAGAMAVSGRVLPLWVAPRPVWLNDQALRLLGLGCVDHGEAQRQSASGADCRWVGGNMALRREAAQRVGPYDVRMAREQDSEYYERCLRAGVPVTYEPRVLVHHRVEGNRLHPDYFRRWHHRAGYFRAYQLEWRPSHLVTVLPLWRYRIMAQRLGAWVGAVVGRRPWWERFYAELKVREDLSLWLHRAALWPRGLLTVVTGRPRRMDAPTPATGKR